MTAVNTVGRVVVWLLQLLRATVFSIFGVYSLLGAAWTLRPPWFTASVDTLRRWVQMWDLATVSIVATLLGTLAAYVFSTKRRARYKSMFDAAVAAENTLALLGTRAGEAATQIAEFARSIARQDCNLYDAAVADLSHGQLQLREGRVTLVNYDRSDKSDLPRPNSLLQASWPHARKERWARLCKQREATLAALNSLVETSSQIESLMPFGRQAGEHSWNLLRDSHAKSSGTRPWRAVTCYTEERYERHRDDLRDQIDRALEDVNSSPTGDDSDATEMRQANLEKIKTTVERLQAESRRGLWELAELNAKLALCHAEICRSRSMRGFKAIIAWFIRS